MRENKSTSSRLFSLLQRAVDLRPGELPAVVLSLVYFFSLLSAYYVIRPVRDEMGILGGVENVQWLFTYRRFFSHVTRRAGIWGRECATASPGVTACNL